MDKVANGDMAKWYLADRTSAEFASQIAFNRDLTETKTSQRLTF